MPNKKNASLLWFLGGLVAAVLAGLAKIAIADHFSPEEED